MNEQKMPTDEAQNSQKGEWYKNGWGILIAVLIFPYFLLWYMWAKTDWSKSVKWVITVIFIFFNIVAVSGDNSSNKTAQQPAQQTTVQEAKKEAPAPQPTIQKIPYEIVTKWDIPNGGSGKRIVIDPKYLNFDDMTALGETIKEDMKKERNAFVFVHTDKKSADLQTNISVNATEADMDYLGKHYVGDYKKNANTGLNQFSISLKGIDDNSEASFKVINY